MTPWVRTRLSRLALAITPLWLPPLAWWLAFSPVRAVSYVGMLLASLELVIVFVMLTALAALVICPVGLLFRKYRSVSFSWLLCAIVYGAAFTRGLGWEMHIRATNVDRVVERGQPLIDAITAYQSVHGHPPATLNEVVPKYIDHIPKTGIGANPEFHYAVGKPELYHGNEWVLTFTPPHLPMGFRSYCYYPRQNYAAAGYGSFDKWGYSGK